MKRLLIAAALLLVACSAPARAAAPTLTEARAAHQTVVARRIDGNDPIEAPPKGVFDLVAYPAAPGPLGAYLSPIPKDGKLHPAIIWITGGDCNSIGDVWTPQPAANDQTASAFRKAGIVLMVPSSRGGNHNPGHREGDYGEVDDILAAAAFLARQPGVDPKRIYLGGHSTGGTLAMLVSESSDRFRAVFAFGPISLMDNGYARFLQVAFDSQQELDLRSPGLWLAGIRSPTFVFEGDHQANTGELIKLRDRSTNPAVHFHVIAGADHFSTLAPTTALIARRILADTGATPNIAFTEAELDQPFTR